MSPDFGYYFLQFAIADFAHTIFGAIAVCVPSGLLSLSLFYLLRQPLCFILPQPHRGALMPLSVIRPALTPRSFLVAVASILLGAWTHTIWDSFTHGGAWSVEHIDFLRDSLFRIHGVVLPASYILQQLSTFGGGAALAIAYLIWLRRQRATPRFEASPLADPARYCLLALLAIIALGLAIPFAIETASRFQGYLAFRVLVFRIGVYATAIFIPLLAVCSCVLYRIYGADVPSKVQTMRGPREPLER